MAATGATTTVAVVAIYIGVNYLSLAHTDNILAAYIVCSGHMAGIGHIVGDMHMADFGRTFGDVGHTFGFELAVVADHRQFLADNSIVL